MMTEHLTPESHDDGSAIETTDLPESIDLSIDGPQLVSPADAMVDLLGHDPLATTTDDLGLGETLPPVDGDAASGAETQLIDPVILAPTGDQSVIPPGQPGGEPLPPQVILAPTGDQSVIPPGQPGGEPLPPQDILAPTGDQSVIPPGQPGGEPLPPQDILAPTGDQSVIPPGQPGGEPLPPQDILAPTGDQSVIQVGMPAEILESGPPITLEETNSPPDVMPPDQLPPEGVQPPYDLVPPPPDGADTTMPQPVGSETPPAPPVPDDDPQIDSSSPIETGPVDMAQPESSAPVVVATPENMPTDFGPSDILAMPESLTIPGLGPSDAPAPPSLPIAPRTHEATAPAERPAPVDDLTPPDVPVQPNIPDVLIPPGPGVHSRQDYSPDDRDVLRTTGQPFEPGGTHQDYSPDDRDVLRTTGQPFEPGGTHQDYSPDDRDVLRNQANSDVPQLPVDGPTTFPDLSVPLSDPSLGLSPLDIPAIDGPTHVDSPLHGDPGDELRWAQVQSENGYCVPVSVAMVVSEITGVIHNEHELVDRSIEMGILYGEPGNWLGMTAEGAVDLLQSYGITADVEYGSLDTLRQYLDEGREIVLMVDADEIWYGDDDGPGDAGMDHAVVLTGIDDDTGVAYLNDPGQPDGPGFEVTLSTIDDAWADGGHQMVVADDRPQGGPGPLAEAERVPAGAEVREPGAEPRDHVEEAGFVLLPVVIAADVLRRVTPWARLTDSDR